MTISISEFSHERGGISRIVNYYAIPITTGMRFSVNIPAYDISDIIHGTANGSSVNYTLSGGLGIIQPDDIFLGDEVRNTNFMISVRSENEFLGFVTGQGPRQLGSYAQVNAFAFEGCNLKAGI